MIGQQLGSYRLVRLIGEGGMGRVFLAEHVTLGSRWAVKVLAHEHVKRPELVARFLDEARAAARITHPNLVQVVEVQQTREGVCYMVLQYLDGITLDKFIKTHGPASPALVIELISRIADALVEIHAQGIIHRDLKPDNIMLCVIHRRENVPMLLDLGVAHLGKLASGPGTVAGTLIGTPCYMAPEQLLGEAVEPASDLFSLGVVVYELATGRMPWQRKGETRAQYLHSTPTQLFQRQQLERPVDPREHVPTMSDAFAKALLAPLAFRARERPRDERMYLVALAQAVPGDQFSADGLQLLKQYAPDLLNVASARSTIRAPIPAMLAVGGPERQYVLGDKLGMGGMAEVFAAQQFGESGFERPVAIKRVLPALLAVPGFTDMFVAEARLASKLSHDNIVKVTDLRKDEDGQLFLVMELVDGKDLATVAELGPLTISSIIHIVGEALRGLGHAHHTSDPTTGSIGIIHRDVSPHNILVSRDGAVKIGDFGLARAADREGNVKSETLRGKVSYMAPEQILPNGGFDHRIDLFAIGIVLWELLTRTRLFTGTQSETIGSVLYKEIPRPSEIAAEAGLPPVPADLEAVTMRLLERDPALRFQTAEAAKQALLACAAARADGRDELVRLMQHRFPLPGEHRPPITVTATPRGTPRAPVTAAATPSTLRSAASQSVGTPAPRHDRRLTVLSLCMFAGAAAIGVVTVRTLMPRRTAVAKATRDAGVAEGVAVTLADAARIAASPSDAAIAVMPAAAPIDAPAAVPIDAAPPAERVAAPAPKHATHHTTVAPSPASTATPPPANTTTNANATATATATATPNAEPGELAIVVKPWATIQLDGKSAGGTPYREAISAGVHHLVLVNEDAGKREALTITVEAGKTMKIERSWQ